MKNKISPSVNIIRDSNLSIDYHVTPNAEKTSELIFKNFDRGIHSFNLIGSFGTGKSSFLWALEKSLKENQKFFKTKFNGKSDFIKVVGDFHSLKQALNDEFGVTEDYTSNQKLFDKIYQRYQKVEKNNGLLVIAIDEFGKFLEYASKVNPDEEIYFIQKLSEFINSPERNILLLTSVHQSLEAYASDLNKQQIIEWRKIRGRFKDLTFNEPVEQLLYLASSVLSKKNKGQTSSYSTNELIEKHHIFNIQNDYLGNIESKLFPLSSISSYCLALSLQRYGQNERSLFTFLNSIKFSELEEKNAYFELPEVYDFLFDEFYNFVISKSNPDYSKWAAIKEAQERIEIIPLIKNKIATDIVKTIGLLSIFSSKGASLNSKFITEYLKTKYQTSLIDKTIKLLDKNKIIRFSQFDSSFKLFHGTDLDIEKAISDAENQIDNEFEILTKLKSHFSFPAIIAKSITYKKGTPRLFEFKLSNSPLNETPIGEIDGFINLIFSEGLNKNELKEYSNSKTTLFGVFSNTTDIFKTLLEIEKTKKVLQDIQDENDRVAIKELRSIIKSNEVLLSHYVMDILYSDKVIWFALGKKQQIRSKKEFNQVLSIISDELYLATPILKNELFNKHKVSGAISSARKNYWKALVNNYSDDDLGFDSNKWPAEKTIYYTLLKKTGIHRRINDKFSFSEPTDQSLNDLWNISLDFLNQAVTSRKPLVDFIDMLSSKPIKLKQGLIDFWIPTFLFIKRGDFALYKDNGFVPYIDENILYMMTRNPKEFYIKSFELNNLRLNLFNKYRIFLQQDKRNTLDSNSFIESIRPLLIFYRNLTDYSKKTNTISKEALELRDAISKATDPEETFFEKFPKALGYILKDLASDDKLFDEYIINFQNKIEEIKASYAALLNRFELFICNEIVGKKVTFKDYKLLLQNRFESIKEHEALTKHKIFLMRVQSNLDDRDSYLMSLCQAIISKPLDQIRDNDESILYDRMISIVKELDNLIDLNKVKINKDELLIKLELTTKTEGSQEQIIRVSNANKKELDIYLEKISSELDKNKKLKLPILVSLLKRELDKND